MNKSINMEMEKSNIIKWSKQKKNKSFNKSNIFY